MKKGRNIVFRIMFLFICGLCISMAGEAVTGEAAGTVSITKFYNNGVTGNGYAKARKGAVVTISNVREMRIFLNCLYEKKWTNGISFRQEADISFSNCTFTYDSNNNQVFINKKSTRIKYTPSYMDTFWDMDDIRSLGLVDVCVGVQQGRNFWGKYDGQGYSISGFILFGNEPQYSGIFGHVAEQASIYRLKIKNCYLNNTCGTFCGYNEGIIEDCSAEYILGTVYGDVGGLAESNGGTILRCRLNNGMLYSGYTNSGYFGGIVANSYGGKISDCAVEHLIIQTMNKGVALLNGWKGIAAGGIAGYQTGGQIRNCSSVCEISCLESRWVANGSTMAEWSNANIGGIVGWLQDDMDAKIVGSKKRVKSEVSNCIFTGRLNYVSNAGGIVGRIEFTESAFEVLLKNNLSLVDVNGRIGGAVGTLGAGQVVACYSYSVPDFFLDMVMNGNSESVTDCHIVNREQVYGEESADIIDANSTYSNTKMLLTALNKGAEDNSDYLKWKAGVLGYPVLISNLVEAPVGDYELGTEIEVSAYPMSNITTPSNQGNENKQNLKKNLAVKNLKVESETSPHVRLSWNIIQWADGYHILRSLKSTSGYKVIGKTSAFKTVYVDKTAKKGCTYYYMVRGYAKNEGSTVYGNGRKKKTQTVWYHAPSLRLSAGKTSDGKSYVQIGVSKYLGSYIEVYFKVDGKNYIKAPLKSKKIAFYNGKLRFSYKTKSLLYCKVRTYEMKKGKKQYSAFSKERKIHL